MGATEWQEGDPETRAREGCLHAVSSSGYFRIIRMDDSFKKPSSVCVHTCMLRMHVCAHVGT